MKIIPRFITRNFTKGRESISFICLHTYNGKGKSLFNWFNNPGAKVSAHYAVMFDGTIEQYVRDEDTAWAIGHGWANRNSISIEFQDNGNPQDTKRTDALYEAGGWLIAQLMKKHFKGDPVLYPHNIKLHKEFTSTGCPGRLDFARLIRIAQKILDEERDQREYEEKVARAAAQKAIEANTNTLPITNQPMKRFTSRKFLLTVALIILFVVLAALDIDIETDSVVAIVSLAAGYLGVEGAADIVQRAKQASQDAVIFVDEYFGDEAGEGSADSKHNN